MSKFYRYFSIFLCLILIFSIAYSPIHVHAYSSPFAISGYGALFSMLFSSDFVSDTGKGIDAFTGLIGDVWLYLTEDTRSILSSYESSDNDSFRLHGTVVDDVFRAFSAIGFKQVLNYGVKHSKIDLSTQDLQKEDFIQENTELYLPTVDQIENLDLLSAQQLIVDYSKQQVSLSKQIKSLLQSFSYSMQGFSEGFTEDYATFTAMVHSYLSATTDWLFQINDNVKVKFGVVHDWLSTINTNIVTKINLLTEWFPTINNNLKTRLDTVATWLSTLNTNMKAELSQVKDWLKGIKTTITTQSQLIIQKLEAIEKQLLIFPKYEHVEFLTKPQIQVQIHDQQQILVQDYASLGTAFEMKLSWIPQIFNFLKELFNRIVYTGEPPKVSVSLSTTAGSVKFNQDAVILDMSWYEPYKVYGDAIISGFLWLGFGWNIYKRTPSILNGIGISQEPYANGSNKRGDDDV